MGLQDLLTKEYMKSLDAFAFKLGQNIKTINLGQGSRKSKSKGNSLEFSDFRDYTPGDDIRRIDWNSYGRLDKLFIKLFNEEKQSAFNIFIDKSKSMDFGETNKFLYAKLLAASIAYIAMKNSDKANIFICDKNITARKLNMSTKNMFADLVKFLDEINPSEKTKLNGCIKEVLNLNLGAGISFVISDFFSEDGFEEIIKVLQSKRQKVYLIHVLDSHEYDPKLSEALKLIDSETGENVEIFISNDILNAYVKTFKNFQNNIIEACEKRGAHYFFAPAGENIIKLLYNI